MSKSRKKSLHFTSEPYPTEFTSENSILEIAIKNNIALNHSCEGMGTCGTCRIVIQSGGEKLKPRNIVEAEMAEDRGFDFNERLACQTCPVDKLVCKVPRQ